MLSNRRSAEGETAACEEDVQCKILHYKLCGRGLATNHRLQFCGWRGSLASIHELTRTENFRIRTPPLSVAGLVIFTKVAKIGGFFKFTALPLQDQTMHANESCHFCSSCALVLKTAESFGIHCLAVDIWLAEYGLRRISGTTYLHCSLPWERYVVFKLKPWNFLHMFNSIK